MIGFTKKSVGTLTLGEKLKKFRSDKRISLGEASRSTKIRAEYLEYLEEGNYGKLPPDVYIRGFLRSYGDFLGADERILLKLYEREKGIKINLEKDKKNKPKKIQPINISFFVFTPKKILISAIAILVLAGLFFLYKEIDSFANAPSLFILNPENNQEIDGNFVSIEGMTDKGASLFINGQPILVSDEGRFRESLTLQSGLNMINVKSINKFEKETTISLNVRSNYQENSVDSQDKAENNEGREIESSNFQEDKKIQIDIRVDPGPVWLSVEADGNLVFDGTMLSGATQIFEAKEKITINSGKGEATFLKFNGKDIGALNANPGPVKNIIFTKDTKYDIQN